MELNILNEKLNVDIGRYHMVDEYRFWHIYCQLLNIRNPILSDKDCESLAHMLSLEDLVSSLLGKKNKPVLMSKLKTSLPNLFSKCKQLTDKGFLIRKEEGYFVLPSLIKFKEFIKASKIDIKFTIPLKLE